MPNKPKIKLTKAGRTRGADYVDRAPVPRSERRRPGRPTAYDERVTTATACFMARQGATDVEIAQALGVSTVTLYSWYGSHPEFLKAVQEAKDVIDDRVERGSILQRALGYDYFEQRVMGDKVIELRKHLPPDHGAGLNWLKNRRRDKWRDTREIDLVVPEQSDNQDDLDTRSLALAAINLLSDASSEPVGRTTLDLEPNSTEEVEDDEPIEDESDSEDDAAEEDGEADAPDEDFDPDFDR